jgi:hypothetical protein
MDTARKLSYSIVMLRTGYRRQSIRPLSSHGCNSMETDYESGHVFQSKLKNALETDEKLTQALLELMTNNPEIKGGVASTPMIQASIKA